MGIKSLLIKKEFNYVYITTCLINNKKYVGDHSTNDLDDGYLGSGIKLKNAINKYGKENFEKEILEFFDTKQEAFDAQEKWIKKYNTLNEGYNISPKGGYGIPNSMLNENTKRKIGLAHKNLKKPHLSEYNIKHKKGKTYKEQFGEEKAEKYREKISETTSGENNPMYGKGYLIEGEKNGMFGKISPRKGKNNTLDQNDKIRLSKIGKKRKTKLCPYCNKNIPDGNYTRWHGENCKHKK